MSFTYKHQFRIERDLFDMICEDAGWQQVVIYPDKWWHHIAICNPKTDRFVISHCCVGNYSPAFRLFYTDKTFRACIDKTPLDSRIQPWCNCCSDTPKIDVKTIPKSQPEPRPQQGMGPPADQSQTERNREWRRAFLAGELEQKPRRVMPTRQKPRKPWLKRP